MQHVFGEMFLIGLANIVGISSSMVFYITIPEIHTVGFGILRRVDTSPFSETVFPGEMLR